MVKQESLLEKKINIKTACKNMAIFSIGLYVVLTTVFESLDSDASVWASLGMYFCLAMCMLYVMVKGTINYNWLIITLAIFGVILYISTYYTRVEQSYIDMYLSLYWKTVILLFLAINAMEKSEDLQFLLNIYILSGVILAIYMYQSYGLDYLFTMEERLDDEMGNQNNVAIRCTFSVILAIYRVFTSKSVFRWLWLLLAAICVPAIMFLGSRKAIIMIVGALLTLFLVYDKNPKTKIVNFLKKLVLIGIIFIVVWILIYNVPAFSVIKDRFEEMFALFQGQTSSTNLGDQNREQYIEEGLATFFESPLWGSGFFYSVYLFGVYSHNNFVELLMNNGLIGFCVFYYIYLKLFLDIRVLKNRKLSIYALMFMLIVALLIMDIGVVSYYSRYSLLLITLCSRIVYLETKEMEKEKVS